MTYYDTTHYKKPPKLPPPFIPIQMGKDLPRPEQLSKTKYKQRHHYIVTFTLKFRRKVNSVPWIGVELAALSDEQAYETARQKVQRAAKDFTTGRIHFHSLVDIGVAFEEWKQIKPNIELRDKIRRERAAGKIGMRY